MKVFHVDFFFLLSFLDRRLPVLFFFFAYAIGELGDMYVHVHLMGTLSLFLFLSLLPISLSCLQNHPCEIVEIAYSTYMYI